MNATSVQLQGFSDVTEDAFVAVVYLCMLDSNDNVHISLVMAKTKVAPIKCLTAPRLEFCRANLLASLLHHTQKVLKVPSSHFFWPGQTAKSFLAGFQGTLTSSKLLLETVSQTSRSSLIQNPCIMIMAKTVQLTVYHVNCCLLSCFSIGHHGTVHSGFESLMLNSQCSFLFCLKLLNEKRRSTPASMCPSLWNVHFQSWRNS